MVKWRPLWSWMGFRKNHTTTKSCLSMKSFLPWYCIMLSLLGSGIDQFSLEELQTDGLQRAFGLQASQPQCSEVRTTSQVGNTPPFSKSYQIVLYIMSLRNETLYSERALCDVVINCE